MRQEQHIHLGDDWITEPHSVDKGTHLRPAVTRPAPATAYLAGPMTGIEHANFPAFDATAARLRAAGWTIYSPAEHDRDTGLTGDEIVTRGEGAPLFAWDFQRIIEASVVIFLPGWERSTGSHWEMAVAYATGKPCFEYHGAGDLRKIELPAVVTQPTKCGLRYEATPAIGGAPIESRLISDTEIEAAAFQKGWAAGRESACSAGRPFRDLTPEELDSLDRWLEAPTDDDVDRWEATREAEAFDAGWRDAEALTEARTRLDAIAATTGPSPAFPLDGEDVAMRSWIEDLVAQPSQPGDWKVAAATAEGLRSWKVGFEGPSETRVVDPETGGAKGQKACRLGALDPVALEQMGLVAGMGEEKYDRFNFLRGYKWSLSVDALCRHLLAFLQGEDNDPESGLPHMAHAAWHAHALTGFLKRGIGTDDRAPRD